MGHMLGDDGLALGGGDLVVHGLTSDLGHGVAVLNLDGDGLDDGVVNAVLSDDGPAGVLDGGLDRVSDGVSNGGDNGGSDGGSGVTGISSIQVLGVSISLGLGVSLPLGDGVVSGGGNGDGGLVTDHVLDLLADLHVLNLLGVDGDGVADVLGSGGAHLGSQDLDNGLAVSGGDGSGHRGSGQGSGDSTISQVLGISLSLSGGLGASEGEQSRNGDNLGGNQFETLEMFWLI